MQLSIVDLLDHKPSPVPEAFCWKDESRRGRSPKLRSTSRGLAMPDDHPGLADTEKVDKAAVVQLRHADASKPEVS